MTDISITLANGRSVSFDVGNGGDEPPCFLLSVRKCGSSITNNICRALAEANGRTFVDVGHTFFTHNFVARDWWNDIALRQIVRSGAIYGGFRDMALGLMHDPVFTAAPKFLMIRDPRDALVSEYFSNAYSHSIPATSDGADGVKKLLESERAKALKEDIQSTVLRRARAMAIAMDRYAGVVSQPNTMVVKYEDVIFEKATLIQQMSAHFGLRTDDQLVAAILGWADVTPAQEDPRSFVRQVAPGDHARKLDEPTIAVLNQTLAGPMSLFGYAA